MNVAQGRPRSWTPQIILFSIIFHAVLLYYVAVAFQVIPPLVPAREEPRTVQAVRFNPPPPVLPDPDPIVQKRPIFQQRPTTAPLIPTVQPSPLPATPTPLQGPATVLVGKPIPEEPVAQGLPRYPVAAIEKNIEGRVVMSITIMPDGSVRDVQVVSAKPSGYFESAAVRAVQTWRYRASPVTRTNVIVFMDFELRDG